MRFKVVPFQDGSQRDDAVLQGIANGFNEMFPVPDHPTGVGLLLDNGSTKSAERDTARRTTRQNASRQVATSR